MENIEDYPGKCFRHHLHFKPNESFDNNCPACWWEREAKSRPTQDAPDLAKVPQKDGPVYIRRVHGGTFEIVDPPSG